MTFDPIACVRRLRNGATISALALAAIATTRSDAHGAELPSINGTYGAASIQGNVDEGTGAMTYAVPFDLPRARGDAQPSLGLSYRSASGTGDAGQDWSLGLPSIERAPLSNWPRYLDTGNGEDEDRYAYAGQDLTYICTAPACPAEAGPMPAWANGYRHYRLRVDRGGSERFFLHPARLTWVVQLRGGQMMEFGKAITRPELADEASDRSTTQPSRVFRWNLARHYDLHGVEGGGILGGAKNLIVYRWSLWPATGPQRLVDIFYTPPVQANSSLNDFAYHVQLSWDAANGTTPPPIYAKIERQKPTYILRRVAITAKQWTDPWLERSVVRIYHLDYYSQRRLIPGENGNPAASSPVWHRRYLKQVQMEGHCGGSDGVAEEDGVLGHTECPRLPPQTFEYEVAKVATGNALTKTPLGPVSANGAPLARALTTTDNTAVLDVNRDGRPDIIGGWQQNGRLGHYSGQTNWSTPGCQEYSNLAGRWVHVSYTEGLGPMLMCPSPEPMDPPTYIRSARDHVAFVNRGAISSGLEFKRHCLDAERLAYWQTVSGPSPVALFSQWGSEVVGPWGDALFLWSKVDNNGIEIEPTSTNSAFCPEANQDSSYPSLRWKKTIDPTWVTPAGTLNEGGTYIDIDGDGYADRLRALPTSPIGRFREAAVNFTRRVSKRDAILYSGPALNPFLTIAMAGQESSAFGWNTGLDEGIYPNSWYADMNGDGLVDLVEESHGVLTGGSSFRVRPGDGRGHFGCRPDDATCVANPGPSVPSLGSYYLMNADVPPPIVQPVYRGTEQNSAWPSVAFFNDVTGDGLADLVVLNAVQSSDPTSAPGVSLWINRGEMDGYGHSYPKFECANPADRCRVASFPSDFPLLPILLYMPTAINPYFADMDANGIDDLVLLTESSVWTHSFVEVNTNSSVGGRAPAPGLLTHVRTGVGADIYIEYKTIQELDAQAAERDPNDVDTFSRPWGTHVPSVVPVVTRVTVQDAQPSMPEPYRFDRTTRFSYRDPAYDLWTRSFKGFKRTRVEHGTSTTETWRWFSECENGRVSPCIATSDESPNAAMVGLPVRVDRFSGDGRLPTNWLSTSTFQYRNESIAPTEAVRKDRSSIRADLMRTDDYVYDTEVPVSRVDAVLPPDAVQSVPSQSERKHVVTLFGHDTQGNATRTVNCGEFNGILGTGGTPSAPNCGPTLTDPEISAIVLPNDGSRCAANWSCAPTGFELQERRLSSSPITIRKQSFARNSAGDITAIVSALSYPSHGSQPIIPPDLNATRDLTYGVGAPSSAVVIPGNKLMAEISRDEFGNAIHIVGPEGTERSCGNLIMDTAYAQFAAWIDRDTGAGNCAGPMQADEMAFDRGLQKVAATIDAQRGTLTTWEYDDFGRLRGVNIPSPEQAWATRRQLSIEYHVQSPLSYVKVERWVYLPDEDERSESSIAILNGLGEHVLSFDSAHSNSQGAPWIARAWTERDETGAVVATGRPFRFHGDPLSVATTAAPLTLGAAKFDVMRDSFGRPRLMFDDGLLVGDYRYKPFVTETRDAEQAKSGGSFAGNFSRVRLDGHGRVVVSEQHHGADTIVQKVDALASGEPISVRRSHSQGPDVYERRLEWDSFGRLVRNVEPNTSRYAGGQLAAWVYAYDNAGRLVGTSDARGCGKNIYYDALGRIRAEDYSPCDASQPPYTVPNLATGDGTEVFYRYDEYEPGQRAPDAEFSDEEGWDARQLVAIYDRGAHTRFNYDARGRLRRTTRRMARPGEPSSTLADRYTGHEYREHLSFDDSDRLLSRRADLWSSELKVNQDSRETFGYDGFRLVEVGSSYGTIVGAMKYGPNGSVLEMLYGDHAATRLKVDSDSRDRPSRHHVFRNGAPAIWTNPGAANSWYSAPGAGTSQLDLLDVRLIYDDVGNPLSVADLSIATWPHGAEPVSRLMQYDAAYRVTRVQQSHGYDAVALPFLPEQSTGDLRPVPMRSGEARPMMQSFEYDWQGNTTNTNDNEGLRFDRSLGAVTNGGAAGGPNQLVDAEGVHAEYDEAGNMRELTVARPDCQAFVAGTLFPPGAPPPPCSHRFIYDWDEVGQLARARRWDFPAGPVPPIDPEVAANWDLSYAYSAGKRVRTSVTDTDVTTHTLDPLGTVRISRADYDPDDAEYRVDRTNEMRFVGGIGRVFFDAFATMPTAHPTGSRRHVFLQLPDHLGSTAVVIDKDSGEVVERTSYQPYGALESGHRSSRWGHAREAFKFTGKEEDIEVGLTYFGARYYLPLLGRWASADPLTIHALGGDLNPYAYVSGRVMSFVDPFGLQGGPPPPVPGARWNGDTQVTTTYDGASDSMARNEDAAGRHLETLSRSGSASAPPYAPGRTNLFGHPPEVLYSRGQLQSGYGPREAVTEGVVVAAGVVAVEAGAVAGAVDAVVTDAGIAVWGALQRLGPVGRFVASVLTGGAGEASRRVTATGSAPQQLCFAKGTKVLMADGSIKAIDDIREGDAVLSDDPNDSSGAESRYVTQIHRTATYRLFHIEIGDGGDIVATGSHPFWTRRGWVTAEALTTDDILTDKDGAAVTIRSLVAESRDAPTFNLSVEGAHTFFVVAGGRSALVHNVDPWDIKFTQPNYGSKFSNGPWAGRTLAEAIAEARTLGRLPNGLTLNAVRMGDGTWATLDNRTLAVARAANLSNVDPTDAGAKGMNKLNQLLRDGGLAGPVENAVMRCE